MYTGRSFCFIPFWQVRAPDINLRIWGANSSSITPCCCSATRLCLTLCSPTNWSTPDSLSFTIFGVCSDSCPLSQWCHPTISSFAAPSPLALKLSQHQGLSQWAGSLHQVANSIAQFLDPKPASGISLGKTMESSLSGFSQWVWGTPLPPSITYSVGLEWSTWHLNDPVLN